MKKAPTKNKNMTIGDLAVLMTKGFERVDKMIAGGRKETNKLAALIADVSEEANKLARMNAEVHEETNNLARMVAKGFGRVDKEFAEVKREITEVKDNLASTRGDILAMGDRFTLKYEFYDLSTRVGVLEQKQKVKMKK